MKYDFAGWATRNDLRCSDGRVIRKHAFKDQDGKTVPLVWMHQHNDPENVLGHALLENREDGVYAYCSFNDTERGKHAKLMVQHGDIEALSIHANRLQQKGSDVLHGAIREVSLVMHGANPGAYIESVMMHGDEMEDEGIIYTGLPLELEHADAEEKPKKDEKDPADEKKPEEKKPEEKTDEKKSDEKEPEEKTVQEVIDSMTEEQQNVVSYLVGMALEEGFDDNDDEEAKHSDMNEGGDVQMKRNVFDKEDSREEFVLSHSDEEAILTLAKKPSVGSFREGLSQYLEDNETLSHGFESVETLFPEYKDVRPGAPELVTRDQDWVAHVMSKVHKSPISRIRTRQADIRDEDIRAKGFKKGNQKKVSGDITLLKRTTDPQTVYRKDALHRDDIIDITDFDVVNYQYGIMRMNLEEELATAFLIGDGREASAEDKISEDHIRSVWNDADLYTIHQDVDIEGMKASLQGSNTSANFGENYIYAEAIIQSALYAREQYKGSGNMDFYCTPHLLNVMLLARDLNGRRIYESRSDLAAALNVNNIYTVEQFEGKTRTAAGSKKKKLLGIFVNLADYNVGATRGGEITKFEDFDIDFNQYKYLIETRLSGALTRVYSAIALEEPVSGE